MPLLNIILVLIVVGVALWAVNRFIPMAAQVKTILNVVVTVVLIVWLLQVFGLLDSLRSVRVR